LVQDDQSISATNEIIPVYKVISIHHQITAPPYQYRVVGEEALNSKEISFIRKNFELSDEEKIINVYSLFKNIEKGGIVLTNIKLISFMEGESLESCLFANLENIDTVNLEKAESFMDYSIIIVNLKNSTFFSFLVSPSENMDDFLFQRILNKINR
jgi:hypothetical protein